MGEQKLSLRRRLALEAYRVMKHQSVKEHRLRQLFWECTLRCNLNCRHCGSDCRSEATQKDMPLEDFLGVLDQITPHVNPNEVFVIISGGEPLMRSDLERCGRAIYERGFPWGMVTNGLAMTEKRYRALRAAGMHTATVSLDGLHEEHNFMRGHARSFEAATNAIRLMGSDKGFIFDVVTCVNRRNLSQLDGIKELLISLGVKAWRLFTIFPSGRAADDPELQLSNEDFCRLLDYIRKNRAEEKRIELSYGCEGFLGNYEGDVRKHFFSCNAGVSVGSVLVDGSISACTSIRADYIQGNIYKDNFWDVWQNRFEPYRNREWMRKEECADCSVWRYCEGNGMHLRGNDGRLMLCHYDRLKI